MEATPQDHRRFFAQAKHRADFAMLLVTLFWGLTFPLIRTALENITPELFLAVRFVLAAIVFLPLVLINPSARRGVRRALLPGFGLGALAWMAYYTQILGLETVPSGRAAFITGTSVIIVPLIAPLFRAGRPNRIELLAAGLATAGLYVLSEPSRGGLSSGDLWILSCAFIYSFYILILQIVLRQHHDAVALAFTQVLGIAICSLVVVALRPPDTVEWTGSAVSALLFCALLATVGTFWLQTRFQGQTTPQRVALIFAMEPVFATAFAYLLLGETLSGQGALGAAMILIAVVGMELVERQDKA